MTRTIEDAIEKFPPLTGKKMEEAIEGYLKVAEECDGIEVAFPDWPEAHAASLAHPDKLSLGSARGPDNWWRRLSFNG